ncbi:D-aminoacyl-tRNA deacylase [Immundisolibacter sp.]
MLALLQRVTQARVSVVGDIVGQIGPGLLVLVGVQPGDGPAQAQRMAKRLLSYRVFDDADGRMNLSLADTGGGLLLVPQFTLAADTDRGRRPSFTSAAEPAQARTMFDCLVEAARACHAGVATGRFGAHMQVSLTNDGPVTFLLRVQGSAE